MTPETKQIIVTDASAALKFIQAVLPILEAAGVATGPAGLGVSAAAAFLIPLIAQIPTGTIITVEEQLSLFQRAGKLMDFSGPEWVPSTAPQTPA